MVPCLEGSLYDRDVSHVQYSIQVGYPQKITRQIWGDRRFTDVEVLNPRVADGTSLMNGTLSDI